MNCPENKSFFRTNILQISLFALSAVIGISGFFLLPDKIFVSLLSNSPVPETETLLFLVGTVLVIGLSALMSIFTENSKKWLAIEVVLLLAQIGFVIYNLIVI